MAELAGYVQLQQYQQQQPMSTYTTFHDICVQPCIVLHISYRLTCKDAVSLALVSPLTARALKGCLQQLQCCPRLLVVASGSKKLLELALQRDGKPYTQPCCTQHMGGADLISEVAVKQTAKRKRRSRITMQRRQNTMWLTGIALGPSSSKGSQAVYLCDYATRGVLQYAAKSLRPLGVFASGADLATPEGIVWVGGTCYVVSAINNSVVALGLTGAVRQVVKLPEGLMPWGLTAWDPARQGLPMAAAAAAANDRGGSNVDRMGSYGVGASAGLFVAVDVEYYTRRYTVPPASTTGGVVCIELCATGMMLDTPLQYSKVDIKRPSGLCFDHTGHLWVTSMDRLLLRLAGPCHTTPGSLLQTVNLQEMLPLQARDFYPFDVQAITCYPSIAVSVDPGTRVTQTIDQTATRADTCAAAAAPVQRISAATDAAMLVVTLHKGPKVPGAIAVLGCRIRVQSNCWSAGAPEREHAEQQQNETADVEVLSLIAGHKALNEPNMIVTL